MLKRKRDYYAFLSLIEKYYFWIFWNLILSSRTFVEIFVKIIKIFFRNQMILMLTFMTFMRILLVSKFTSNYACWGESNSILAKDHVEYMRKNWWDSIELSFDFYTFQVNFYIFMKFQDCVMIDWLDSSKQAEKLI